MPTFGFWTNVHELSRTNDIERNSSRSLIKRTISESSTFALPPALWFFDNCQRRKRACHELGNRRHLRQCHRSGDGEEHARKPGRDDVHQYREKQHVASSVQ